MRTLLFCLWVALATLAVGGRTQSARANQAAQGDPRLAPGPHDMDLGEVRLHYVVQGRGPLLFVVSPGWGVGSLYLQKSFRPMKSHLTLLFIDTRGSGGSTRPADPSHMSRAVMADDIEALRQQLGLPVIDLLGHSDGGAIAIEYAARHAAQVRKLVLVDTAVHGDRDPGWTEALVQLWADDPQYRDAVQEFQGGTKWGPGLTDKDLEHSVARLLPLYVSDPSRYLQPLEASLAGTQMSAFAAVSQAEAEKAAPTPDLSLIRAQTLIINGTADWICPYPVAQRLHKTLANSQLSLYVNKGHFPWVEAGPRFFAEVEGFLVR